MKRIFLICTLYAGCILYVIDKNDAIKIQTINIGEEAREDAPEEFIKFHRGIRTQEGKNSPSYEDNYQFKELKKARELVSKKSLNARTQNGNGVQEWKERGPGNVPGRTRGLIVDPDDTSNQTWFAGSASGGIWKTTNGGASWQWLTPQFPNLATTVLVMAPSNHNILYAGTGEGFGNLDGVQGHGIFKSSDKGVNWTLLESTSNMEEINRILVDPTNASIVIAASNNGIYRSTNGGINWAKTFSGVAQDLRATPGNFNTIYSSEYGKGVLKSIDGGLTWNYASNGINSNGRIEIAVSRINTNRIFASAQGTLSGVNSDLYISDNGGTTWALVDLQLSGKTLNYLGNQGWYDNTIECDPFNQNVVYVGGIGLYRVEITQGASGNPVGSYTLEEVNTASFLNLVNFGASAYQGKLSVGPSANKLNVEIRFGTSESQKAHRFLVPEGSTSGVPDASYSYADYVNVPFEVWDVTNNKQLMVSFRDQDRNGKFNLYEQNTTGTSLEQSREYIYISNVDYNESVPNTSIAATGGHIFQNMYFIWPTLSPGAVWNEATLPSSKLKFIYSEVVKVSSSVISAADPYSEYDGKNNRNFVHPDQHNIIPIIESESLKTFRLLIANDAGLFLSLPSSTPGIAQGDWSKRGLGYNTSQFYGADKRPGAQQYFGGMQDNSTYYSPEGEVASLNTQYVTNILLSGDGFEVIWNNLDGRKMIGGSQFNNFSRSLDGGQTWSRAINGLTLSGSSPDQSKFPFISKLANSTQAPDILFTAGSEGIWKSNDFGGSWTLTPISEKWGVTSFMDVEVSRANANIIWAGSGMSSTRSIYYSKNGGLTYQASKTYTQAVMGSITKLASHPTEQQTAYALFSIARSPKILRTKDLGETWEDITGFVTNNSSSTRGFPDVAVYCLYVRPDNPDILWAGTEIGIVESLDGGNSWALLEDFPNVSVWDMKGQDDEIVIATHGRGIWTAKVEASQTGLIQNPKIIALGTSPKSDLVLKVSLQEDFDSTQVWINNTKAGKLEASVPGEYIVTIKGAPKGTIEAKLISFKNTAPIHSVTFSGQHIVLNSYQKQYFNYFNNSNDIVLGNFSIQPFGNANTSLKSLSNYPNNAEHVALLKQPIIVENDYPFFFYRDVAIVEPGASGSSFGQPAFKDYVVAEATKDGMNWIPIANGYNASFNSSWLTTYNSGQAGTSNLFIDQNINLKDKFNVNDTLLFRFRLFSDNSINAWGWAIDDLFIQQKPTGIQETINTSYAMSVLPNPNHGSFKLNYFLSEDSPVDIIIYNLSGLPVYSDYMQNRKAGKQEQSINLQQPDGIYLAKIKTKNRIEVMKIIIKN